VIVDSHRNPLKDLVEIYAASFPPADQGRSSSQRPGPLWAGQDGIIASTVEAANATVGRLLPSPIADDSADSLDPSIAKTVAKGTRIISDD